MQRRTRRFPSTLLLIVFLPLLIQGCGSGDGITNEEGSSTVTLSVNGLQPIAGGLNYQAWIVHGGGSNSYGYPLLLFNINEDGRMVDPATDTLLTGPYHADVAVGDVQGITISLELTDRLLESSSFTFILSGELNQGTAKLSAEDFFALNRDFSNVQGHFVLATPTDEDPDNELAGVWFMDPSSNPVQAGLVIPDLPSGWIYEGWAEVDGHAVSTGKFVFPNQPDSTAFYSSGVVVATPPFPGEDFLFNPPQGVTFPLDPSGAKVFVTIEPWHQWDTYPEDPFFLRILEGQLPALPVASTLYGMTSLAGQLPTGTATVY